MNKVKNVRIDGKMVKWTVEYDEGLTRTREYRTNQYGEGIFDITNGDCRQINGTLDFSLAGYSESGIRKKLKRIYE